MVKLSKYVKHELYEIFGIGIWAFVVGIILTQFSILALEGASITNILTKNAFYTAPLVGGILVILFLKIVELIQGKKQTINAVVHDPTQGLLKNFHIGNFYPLKNIFTTVLTGMIIFIPFGLVGVVNNTWFGVGIPSVIQQATPGAKLIDSIEPATSSESFIFLTIMSLFNSLIFYLSIRFKWNKTLQWVLLLIPGFFLFGFLGLNYHKLVYGGQELALLFVFFFWGLGALITFATQSIILFYEWHYFNNLFLAMNILFANDIVIIYTGIIYALILSLFVYLIASAKKTKISNVYEGE